MIAAEFSDVSRIGLPTALPGVRQAGPLNGFGQIPGVTGPLRNTPLFGLGQASSDPSGGAIAATLGIGLLGAVVTAAVAGIVLGAAFGIGTSISPIRTKGR